MDDISLSTGLFNNENITLSYEPQHISLEADKGRIIQVISNLLGNGIKFTKEGADNRHVRNKRQRSFR